MDYLLSVQEEDSIHAKRSLNVERRPFERISKRILGSSILAPNPKLPTPPPDGESEETSVDQEEKDAQEQAKFRDDVQLDFTTFEASIIRAQFLLNSNVQERERYAEEKIRIQAAAQDVSEDITRLRLQLEEAKKQLALRKTYDQLAEQITSNKTLRPRAEQHANIEKLNNEIAELEQESEDYAQTWAERRQQFGRIIGEAMELRRMIRDEKEEVERKEGMEGRDDGDDNDAVSARGRTSTVGTPRAEAGGATPMRVADDDGNLAVNQGRDRSRLRQATPRLEVSTPPRENDRDINMAEDGEVSGDESDGQVADDNTDSRSRQGDNMDTT